MFKKLNCFGSQPHHFSISEPYKFSFKQISEVEYEESFIINVRGRLLEDLNDDDLFNHASEIAKTLYLKEINRREHELRYYYYYYNITVNYVSLKKIIRFYSDEFGLNGRGVDGKEYYTIIKSPVEM